ncbi:PrgI family protein [Candidatus Parcubacteria bacterium]|nr:MAG: PrgI family protein [Candidatus Parcubacteria bacterium]
MAAATIPDIMKEFQVPQFITVEDRIVGPFTLRQFFFLLGGASILLVGWFLLPLIVFFLLALPAAAGVGALPFAKVQGLPLTTVLSSAMNYYTRPRLYVWRALPPKGTEPKESAAAAKELEQENQLRRMAGQQLAAAPKPGSTDTTLTEKRLQDLAWSLDIKETVERPLRQGTASPTGGSGEASRPS